jgi:hypothetical protein
MKQQGSLKIAPSIQYVDKNRNSIATRCTSSRANRLAIILQAFEVPSLDNDDIKPTDVLAFDVNGIRRHAHGEHK